MPKNNMKLDKFNKIALAGGILLIGASLFYYLVIYTPGLQSAKEQSQIENKKTEIREKCITQTVGDMKKAHPAMETPEITRFRVANDRGCFIEAGGGDGHIEDPYFKPKFQSYNIDYYQECNQEIKAEVERRVEVEKQKRISECIELYQE